MKDKYLIFVIEKVIRNDFFVLVRYVDDFADVEDSGRYFVWRIRGNKASVAFQ